MVWYQKWVTQDLARLSSRLRPSSDNSCSFSNVFLFAPSRRHIWRFLFCNWVFGNSWWSTFLFFYQLCRASVASVSDLESLRYPRRNQVARLCEFGMTSRIFKLKFELPDQQEELLAFNSSSVSSHRSDRQSHWLPVRNPSSSNLLFCRQYQVLP